MSETTTKVTAANIKGTVEASESNGKTRDTTPMVLYATKEECLANVPEKVKTANEKKEGTWKPICVTRADVLEGVKEDDMEEAKELVAQLAKLGAKFLPRSDHKWMWAVGHVNALAVVSGMDGYSASTGERGPRKPVDKGAVVTDAFSHWTVDQLKSAGISQPIIDAILANRKDQQEKTTAHPANVAAKEANKTATSGKGGKGK